MSAGYNPEQTSVILKLYLLWQGVAAVNLPRCPSFAEPVLPHVQRRATRALQDTKQSICIWQNFMRYMFLRVITLCLGRGHE